MIQAIFLVAIIIVVGLSIIPEVNSEHKEIAQVNRIYALIDEPPYYNSTEYWIIVYSADQITVRDLSGELTFGFAYWGIDHDTSICNMFPEIKKFNACGDEWLMIGNIKGDGCWDGKCMSLLQHEIKHLLCDCDWHENMTPERVNFKNVEQLI